MSLVDSIKKRDQKIVGYGASGRANTIIQYCGITNDDLDYIVDDAPAKQGMYTPGSHIKIFDNTYLIEERPEYILLFAWSFFAEIAKKCEDFLETGGEMIVPLPKVKIINKVEGDKKQ